MNRVRVAVAATLVSTSMLAGAALAGQSQGTLTPVLGGKKVVPPLRGEATIEFTAQVRGHVSVAVYDLNGRLVRVLVDNRLSRGTHSVTWDRSDEARRVVASGVYAIVVQTPLDSFSRRVFIR